MQNYPTVCDWARLCAGANSLCRGGGTDLRSGDIAVAFVMADILEDAEKLFSGETESA